MSAAGKRHMERVARLGCVACALLERGETGAQVHHIREGRVGRNDFLTIPLCLEHHQGTRASVHQAKPALMRQLQIGSEFDLLAETIRMLEQTR